MTVEFVDGSYAAPVIAEALAAALSRKSREYGINDTRQPSADWTVLARAEWMEGAVRCFINIPPMTIENLKEVVAQLNGLADDLGDVVCMKVEFFPKRKGPVQ